jgi:Na+-driven multidrug efflux pump
MYSGIATILIYAFARPLAAWISRSSRYLRVATPMLIAANWETPYAWIRTVVQTVAQALQYGTSAAVYCFFVTILLIAVVAVMYATGTRDSIRLMYAIPISAAIGVGVGLIMLIWLLRTIWKMRQKVIEKASSSINLETPPVDDTEIK